MIYTDREIKDLSKKKKYWLCFQEKAIHRSGTERKKENEKNQSNRKGNKREL